MGLKPHSIKKLRKPVNIQAIMGTSATGFSRQASPKMSLEEALNQSNLNAQQMNNNSAL